MPVGHVVVRRIEQAFGIRLTGRLQLAGGICSGREIWPPITCTNPHQFYVTCDEPFVELQVENQEIYEMVIALKLKRATVKIIEDEDE